MNTAEILFNQQLIDAKLTPFVREHVFHEKRKWRFDFSWPEHKVAIEIEGGLHNRGRHVRPDGFTDDCEKYNEATLLGWKVLRVPTGWVTKNERALDYAKRALRLTAIPSSATIDKERK